MEGKIVEGETSKSENDQEKVSDNLEEVGMVDTMEEEKKEDTDGKIRKIRDSVERELEESDEFNSSQDNLVIDEQDTKKDKHVSFTLPEQVNVSFEESAQRGNTGDFVRADEMQQHSESTKDVFRKEQEGSTEDQKYIDFDDNDEEDDDIPLTQNTHRARYVNSSDENQDSVDSKDIDVTAHSDSGNEGDIFSKWAEKKKGDKLQR